LNCFDRNIVKRFPVCSNGCVLFNTDDAYPIRCINPECRQDRYKKQDLIDRLDCSGVDLNNKDLPQYEPVQTMSVASVASSLAELLLDDDVREQFNYRSQFDHQDDRYQDVFSGLIYKNEYLANGRIADSDICLVIFVDGFPNKNKPKTSQTMIHGMIMNIDPSNRYSNSKTSLFTANHLVSFLC
jgi:hypothetical protein